MTHPLIIHRSGNPLRLPPLLLPPARCYALMASHADTRWEWGSRYDRADRDTHRFAIADTRGPLVLTVPVARPSATTRRLSWADIVLSDHGRWQETIPTALASAYGRTPFFEFYADRLLPVIAGARGGDRLIDFAEALDTRVRAILGLDAQRVIYATDPTGRHTLPPTLLPPDPSYWQIRVDTLGFIPGLSILDLIFNVGPEAPLYLRPLT